MLLSGKTALVTGASRGIGAVVAAELAVQGAYVIGTATTESGAQKITEMLETCKLAGRGEVLEVRDALSFEAFTQALDASKTSIDILVNNAGVTRDNLLLRMKEEEWQEVIDVDLTAIFRLSKHFVRSMLKQRWGRIINISSIVGCMGNAGQANYAAAKAGMIGFSKSLAREVAPRGITVNCIAPGFIETDMTDNLPETHKQALLSNIPMGRIGCAEEIAAAVNFLASPKAGYITGETLHVNGGMYMG